jgi:predicted DsbA family dithiol-disulfide isomerase
MAETVGMNSEIFRSCLKETNSLDATIEMDKQQAELLGLQSTPSFAIGWLDSQRGVHVSRVIVGAQPTEMFVKEIEEVSSTMRRANMTR